LEAIFFAKWVASTIKKLQKEKRKNSYTAPKKEGKLKFPERRYRSGLFEICIC